MNYTPEENQRFRQFYELGVHIFKENRLRSISELSPYSTDINRYINTIDELKIYTSQKLVEAFLTRNTLLYPIDPNFCDKQGVSNLHKMLQGNHPCDHITGEVIELHHIGQQFNSPFAELPHTIHSSNKTYSILHCSNIKSWRGNKDFVKQTNNEISEYWKKRGAMYK